MKKKLLSTVLAISLIFTVVPCFANTDKELNKKSIIEQKVDSEKKLVNYINRNLDKNQDVDSIINTFFSDTTNLSPAKEIGINMYKNNLKKDEDTTYELKDGRTITFSKDGLTFSISDYPVILKKALNDAKNANIESLNSVTASYVTHYTETYTSDHSWYSWIGLKLYSLYAKGYFKFTSDGKVVPYLQDAWYTRGLLSIWQVSDWAESTSTHDSGLRAEFYGQGKFHFGIEIKGYGIVIQDKYSKVWGYAYGEATGLVNCYGSDWYDEDYQP